MTDLQLMDLLQLCMCCCRGGGGGFADTDAQRSLSLDSLSCTQKQPLQGTLQSETSFYFFLSTECFLSVYFYFSFLLTINLTNFLVVFLQKASRTNYRQFLPFTVTATN